MVVLAAAAGSAPIAPPDVPLDSSRDIEKFIIVDGFRISAAAASKFHFATRHISW
jgi:hypothetical protein